MLGLLSLNGTLNQLAISNERVHACACARAIVSRGRLYLHRSKMSLILAVESKKSLVFCQRLKRKVQIVNV